jgi:SAM-dependent methyltransferase
MKKFNDQTNYPGQELELFSRANNWKQYWLSKIKAYIYGNVLEVGAGFGVNTRLIIDHCPLVNQVTAVEPDKQMSERISGQVGNSNANLVIRNGFLKDMPLNTHYDTILYIDVLEHIENDFHELKLASSFLKEGGHLVILVPAHNYLLNPFDRAIGHYRRYNKRMLNNAIPGGMIKQKLFYLDSLGLMASMMNTWFLKQKYPTEKQILMWDKMIIPFSKISDKVFLYTIGKSLIGIWKKSKLS